MMRISTNEMQYRYLKYSSYEAYSPFKRFCEKLGINIGKYHDTKYDLLENQIIVPNFTIKLPEEFYRNWKNYPVYPKDIIDEKIDNQYGILYDMYWFSEEKEEEWFLHPFDRIEVREKYKIGDLKSTPSKGEYLDHSNGHKFMTTNIYVAYWQVYRIFEILEDAKSFFNIDMLTCTPEKIENIAKHSIDIIQDCSESLARIKKKWDANSTNLDYLSYYRTLRGICLRMELDKKGDYHKLVKKGAYLIKEKYSIMVDNLEHILNETFRKEFHNWSRRKDFYYSEIRTLMQKDVFCLTEWLCYLTDKKFEYYFEKYENKNRITNGYTDLLEVLPFEYERSRKVRVEIIWPYFEAANKNYCTEILKKDKLCEYLLLMEEKYSTFYIFIRCIYKMYIAWNTDAEITFDNSSIIDYLIILLGKSETLLKEIIDQKDNHGLTLGSLIKLYNKALLVSFTFKCGLMFCVDNWREYTKSGKTVAEIADFVEQSELSSMDKWFAKSLLIYAWSRNYFVHYYSFDNENVDHDLLGLITQSSITSVILLGYSYREEKKIAEQSLQPDKLPWHDSC